MARHDIFRIAAGALVVLIGVAMGLGSLQLWSGVPSTWSDVVASDSTARIASRVLLLATVMLLAAGVATTVNLGSSRLAAALATVIGIAVASWENYRLFGAIRPAHMVTNLVVGALILWLLWVGQSRTTS